MSRRSRYGKAYLLENLGAEGRELERLTLDRSGDGSDYNEDWLQGLVFEHPELLPFGEIDPTFAPVVPVCRELPTEAGPIDVLFVSDTGLLTLVECKLWRNPEARREVVGQILDYAKEISTWGYEDLLKAVRKATGTAGNVLFDKVQKANDTIEELDFVDDVTRNLTDGRFLLMILGDGIRESVERIAGFLQRHSGLHFTFALVEMALYRMPTGTNAGYIVQPRVLARTVEIERAVVRRLGEGVAVEDPPELPLAASGTRRPAFSSQQEFMDELTIVDHDLPRMLTHFLEQLLERGFEITVRRSLIIHWMDDRFRAINFGTFRPDGTFTNDYIAGNAQDAGDLSLGERYLEGIAALLPGSSVVRTGLPWTWRVKTNGKNPAIRAILEQRGDQWLQLIETTLAGFMALKREDQPD